MLEVKNLTYRVGSREILDGVSLTARDGEITLLVGNNGSGKTTLLRAVTAYHENRAHISGNISIDGESAALLTPRIIASRIALMPQTLPIPKMTVRELVALGRSADRSPFSRETEEDRKAIEEAIAALELSDFADTPLAHLSGGERQSAYLSLLLAKGAKNLILDEPASALDSKNRRRLFSFLREMRDEGRTVLTVLHDLTEASELADRIVVLDKRRVAFDGAPSELRKSDIPEVLFGLQAVTTVRDGKEVTVYLP